MFVLDNSLHKAKLVFLLVANNSRDHLIRVKGGTEIKYPSLTHGELDALVFQMAYTFPALGDETERRGKIINLLLGQLCCF